MDTKKSKEDKGVEAQTVFDFYTDLMENSKHFLKYYLAEDIVLDWFGQTVRGQKDVATFIKTKINPIRHVFREAKPTDKIGFRSTHVVRTPKPARRMLRSAFMSPPRPTLMTTPVKQPQASTSARRQIISPLLDTCNNNTSKQSPPSPVKSATPQSPRKRQKMTSTPTTLVDNSDIIDVLEGENDVLDCKVKYLTAEGHVEFHRPSLKKLQRETKWQRPCKIHIAYDSGKDIKDSNFYLIIYEGNVKCRRNLMKDFEAEESED